MFNFLRTESPVMRFLDKMKDLIWLNLIWIAFCIPVVTIGPATTSLYMVARKMARGDWPKVWRTFITEFKQCFRKSFLMSLCLLVPEALLGIYLFVTVSGPPGEAITLTVLCGIAGILLGFICSYAWPLSAYFENTVPQTLKNAMLLPMTNPLLALAVTALNLLPWLLLLLVTDLFIEVFIIWLVIGFALTAFINCKLLTPFFSKFTPDGEEL